MQAVRWFIQVLRGSESLFDRQGREIGPVVALRALPILFRLAERYVRGQTLHTCGKDLQDRSAAKHKSDSTGPRPIPAGRVAHVRPKDL